MKKAILILSSLVICITGIFSQVPQTFNYQASLRDNSGQLLSLKTVSLRISIIQGTIDGTSVYSEIHSVTTTIQGIINLQIGTGETTSDFTGINWSKGPYFIKIELDPEGGDNYFVLGTNLLASVPYALLAKSAEEVDWQNIRNKPEIADRDIYIKDTQGIILTSPDGHCWKGKMTNSGTLRFDSIRCPGDSGILTQDGLVSFYEFNGNAQDKLGNHNGTESHVQYMEGADSNQYLSLNGMYGYVDLNFPFDFESKTVNLWFKVTEEQGEISLLYVSDNTDLVNGMTIMGVERWDSDVFLTFNYSSQLYRVNINENVWYNASITNDHGSWAYYLNGELLRAGKTSFFVHSYNGVGSAIVGCGRTIDRSYFDGSVDNLRIYNRALTEPEIKALYLH